MKKDFNKICIRTILTYFIIVALICLMRTWGINYFEMKYDNEVINTFSRFVTTYNLKNIWYSITLYFYTYIILSISCNDNSKRMKIYALIVTAIAIPFKFLVYKIPIKIIRSLVEILFLMIPPVLYKREFKNTIKNIFIFLIINTGFQGTALICKNITYVKSNNFITNITLDIDYMIILLLFYYYFFNRKEGKDLWKMVVGLFLDLWHGFTQLQVSLLESLKHLIYGVRKQIDTIKKVFKLKRKESVDSIIFLSLYYLLTLIWNVITIVMIIYIASINNMAITITFILFSFLINKGKFGKPLHLKSAFYCFIISNISYYFISRLTLPIGTSYLVPILLGVLLAYFTALIVKYTTKELYRGIEEKELRELCRIKNIEEYKADFLVDFYSKKMNYVQLQIKYRYSLDRLRHMKMEYMKEFKNS